MKSAYIIIAVLFLLFSYVVFRVVIRRDYKKRMKLTPISYVLEVLVFAMHANSIYLILPGQWPYLPSLPEDLVLKTVSFILLIMLSPVLLLISVLLVINNRGTPFFFQDRPGKNEKKIRIVKFKSMTMSSPM